MEKLINEYLNHRQRDFAKTTWERVRWQLLSFMRFLQCLGFAQWEELTSEEINAFLTFKRKTIKEKSLENLIGALRGFTGWLYEEGYFLVALSFSGDLKRGSYHPRFTPSQKLTKEVLENAEKGGFPQRRRAILELIYSAGLRRVEVHRLNISDFQGAFLRVLGKGGRERVVPVGIMAQEALKAYLEGERLNSLKNPTEEALFLSKQGKRLGGHSLALQVPKEVHGELTLHGLRHACATHMLENGASVVHLQKLLGHERLSTTAIYTKVSTKNLKEMLNRCHPRG